MKQRAFTLIELVIVIGIISTLLIIAVPKLSVIENYSMKIDINAIVMDINKCRNMAVSSKKPSEINFEKPGVYYYKCGDYMSDPIEYSDSLNISESNTKVFKFSKRGVPSMGGSGTIVFTSNNKSFRISVVPITGKVNVYRSVN